MVRTMLTVKVTEEIFFLIAALAHQPCSRRRGKADCLDVQGGDAFTKRRKCCHVCHARLFLWALEHHPEWIDRRLTARRKKAS